MKNILIATSVFVGTALIGGFAYKAYVGCPKMGMPDCAQQSLDSYKNGQYKMTITPVSTTADEVTFKIESSFKCPIRLSVGAHLDKSTLPEWPEDLDQEAAYVGPATALLENGVASVTFTPEEHPELEIIPAGKYMATAVYDQQKITNTARRFYEEYLHLDTPDRLSGAAPFDFTSPVTQEDYAPYIRNWLEHSIPALGAAFKANLSTYERAFGKSSAQKVGENTVYKFPKTLHEFVVDKKGNVVSVKRYYDAEEGQ